MFPSRNTFTFHNGVVVSSVFCGGNLMECHEIDEEKLSYRFMSQEDLKKAIASHQRADTDGSDEDGASSDTQGEQSDTVNVYHSYECLVCPDGYPYMTFEDDDGREPGFFFAFSGLKQSEDTNVKRHVRFHFPNLTHQAKLLGFGHKPVVAKVSKDQYKELVEGHSAFFEQDWKRIDTEVEFINRDNKFGIVFEHELPTDMDDNDVLLFAYTYPFTFNDMLLVDERLAAIANDNKDKLYFREEVIANSIEGRPLKLLTISSPEAIEQGKPVVFLSSRVHSGEAPASFMLQGVIDLLTRDLDNV